MAHAIARTAGMQALMATSIAVFAALSSTAYAQEATTGGVGADAIVDAIADTDASDASSATTMLPTSTVLNGQINLNSVISDVKVVYDDGSGVDATAASFANDFTAATRGSTLDLTSNQTNSGQVRAKVDVTVDEIDGYVGANSVAIGNKVLAGSNFTGSNLAIGQTNNARVTATTNLTTSDGWGQVHGSATAIGNSVHGAAAGFGNEAPLNATSNQTNNANIKSSVNLKTDNTNHAAFTSIQATSIGNTATYGSDW
ncbi:MAG: hypothetical protein R8J41_02305 [Alphaproteobacteria bacterium]|nr:hypothetical protein [Alphaproteobacteria bacterium]